MKKILYAILVAFVFASCTEDIELKLNDTYERLVVEGSITNEAKAHQIKLTKTSSYFSNESAPKVSNAVITISDGEKTIELNESNIEGVYETPSDFKGDPGKTYVLNIDNVEINGKTETYTASSQMRNVGVLDSIELVHEKRFGLYFVNIYAWDPANTKDFYLFNVYLNGELYSDTLFEVIIQNDDFFNGNYTYGITSQILDENDVSKNDTVTFELCGITEEYYNFLVELQSESGFSIPLFSGPPANVRTNISNGGIGFFTAYSVDKASKTVE